MSIILSIDPGQHDLGYSISKIKEDKNICVIEHGTYHPHTAWKKHPELKKYGKHLNNRTLNGKEISLFIKEIVEEYNPNYIVSEDAFYNPGRPSAYISLLICLYAIETSLYSLLRDDNERCASESRLFKMPPKSVKRVVFDGSADKKDMLIALGKLIKSRNIEFMGYPVRSGPNLKQLTEHEIDAICIGYAFTKIWLPIIEENILPSNVTALNKTTRKQLAKKKYKNKYIY